MGSPPTGPASPGRLPIDFRPRRSILLPYNDLLIDAGLDQFLPIDPKGFALTLGMVYGLGPNEPRVLRTDDAGSLVVTTTGATAISKVALARTIDGLELVAANSNDGVADNFGLFVHDQGQNWNGATWDRRRSASAANLAALSGLGAALAAPPGEWAVQHNPAVGVQAIATKVAGGAGVRHVCRSLSFGFSSQAALGGVTTVTFLLTDGGVTIMAWTFDLPAAIIAPISITSPPLNYVGGANAAMTVQSDAAHAGLRVFTNFSGFDAS